MQSGNRVDNFKVLADLGEGFSGTVKLARCLATGQLVALKLCEILATPSQLEMLYVLREEARILARLSHPHVIELVKYSPRAQAQLDGRRFLVSYLALELAPKGDLFEFIRGAGGLGEAVARVVFGQLLAALRHVHALGVAHRDLKPENVLFDQNLQVKLVDFGFAVAPEPQALNSTYIGTELYMSPEQHRREPYDAKKIDVFAAGMVLFVLVRGRPPFNSAVQIDPLYKIFTERRAHFWAMHNNQTPGSAFSPAFVELIDGMLDPEPARRWSLDRVAGSAWLGAPSDAARARENLCLLYEIYQQKRNNAEMPADGAGGPAPRRPDQPSGNSPEPQPVLRPAEPAASPAVSQRSRLRRARKAKQIRKRKSRASRPKTRNSKHIRRARKKGNG